MLKSLPYTVFLISDSPGSVTLPAVLEETETSECRGCLGGVGQARQELMVLWDVVSEPGVCWCQGSAPALGAALAVPCPAVAEMEELVREEKLGLCPGVWQHHSSVTVTLAMAGVTAGL